MKVDLHSAEVLLDPSDLLRLACMMAKLDSCRLPSYAPSYLPNSDPHDLMQDLIKGSQDRLVGVHLLISFQWAFLYSTMRFAIDALLAAKRHFDASEGPKLPQTVEDAIGLQGPRAVETASAP
jgi:hypothetical protein